MVTKLRAVVIDDEPLNREELKYLLSLHPDVVLIGEAGDMSSGWKLVEGTKPNLVFLDIHMDRDTAGLDLGRKLRRLPGPPRLVFITGHPEHALDGYDCHPDDFLTKPVDDAQLAEALNRVREALARTRQPTSRVALPHTVKNRFGDIERVTGFAFPQEILFIQANSNGTVHVRLAEGKILDGVRRTLGDLETLLLPHGFFRVHKSFLVNLARVHALKPRPGDEAYKIALEGVDKEIPVGRQRLGALRAALEKPEDCGG